MHVVAASEENPEKARLCNTLGGLETLVPPKPPYFFFFPSLFAQPLTSTPSRYGSAFSTWMKTETVLRLIALPVSLNATAKERIHVVGLLS